MQKIISFIEKYFWAIMIAGGVVGIFFPQLFISWKPSLSYLLGFILLLSFLKIDSKQLLLHFKKPKLVLWMTAMEMFILPVLFFYLFKIFSLDLAIAVLIIMAVPPGVAAPAMTDIFKGNIPLSIVFTVLAHLIIPLTLPLLLLILVEQKIELNILDMIQYISIVVVLPFILSIVIKKISKKIISKTEKYYKAITIIIIVIIIMVAIAINASYITSEPLRAIMFLLLFSGLAIVMHYLGILIVYKKTADIQITSAVNFAYNNMALGLLIAMEFFSPQIVFYIVCYEIVWNVLPLISKFILKAHK